MENDSYECSHAHTHAHFQLEQFALFIESLILHSEKIQVTKKKKNKKK